jgi:hypothetical protein
MKSIVALTPEEAADVAYLMEETMKERWRGPENTEKAIAKVRALIEGLLAKRYAHIEEMEIGTLKLIADYRRWLIHKK